MTIATAFIAYAITIALILRWNWCAHAGEGE